MVNLILSGMGSSAPNWLPLLSPLVAIVVVAYAYQTTVKYIQRRKAEKLHSLSDVNAGQIELPEPGSSDGEV